MARNDHDGRSLEERLASLDAMNSENAESSAVAPSTGDAGPSSSPAAEQPPATPSPEPPQEAGPAEQVSNPWLAAPPPPPVQAPAQDAYGAQSDEGFTSGSVPLPPGFPPYGELPTPPPYSGQGPPPLPYDGGPMPQPFEGGMLPPPYEGFQPYDPSQMPPLQAGHAPQQPIGGTDDPQPFERGQAPQQSPYEADQGPQQQPYAAAPVNGQSAPPLDQLPPYPPGQFGAPDPASGFTPEHQPPPPEGYAPPQQPAQPQPEGYAQSPAEDYASSYYQPQGEGYPQGPPPQPAGEGYAPGPPQPQSEGYAQEYAPGPPQPPAEGYGPPPQQPPTEGYAPGPQQPPADGYSPGPQQPPAEGYGPGPQQPPAEGYVPGQPPMSPGFPPAQQGAYAPGPYPGQPGYGPQQGPQGPQGPPAPGYPPPGHPQQQQPPQSAESLSSENLLGERRIAPSSGWRRAVYKATGGNVHPGESQAEMRRKDLIARARTIVNGGHHRVAVMSLKGGVGKTTTTTGLGSMLASLRGDRVIAVDANPDRGTLSDKVKLETAATVRDLVNSQERIHRYADVRAFTSQNVARLEVLASDRDPAVSEAFSADDYSAVAVVLEQYYSICITDCGTGLLHSAMAGVLSLADQLVLVSSPSVDGARSASATLDWLEAHDHGHLVRNGVVVLSMVRNRTRSQVDLDKLQAHFESRCRAVVRIPYDDHLEEGAEVDLEQLAPATREAYLNLAAVVGDGFAIQRRPTE